MKIKVTESMFCDIFATYGRKNNFSSEGLSILFSYLENLEQDTGSEMELDVIALCCDYSEMTLEQFAKEFGLQTEYKEPVDVDQHGEIITVSHKMSDDELKEVIEQYFIGDTTLVGFTDNTVVFRAF